MTYAEKIAKRCNEFAAAYTESLVLVQNICDDAESIIAELSAELDTLETGNANMAS